MNFKKFIIFLALLSLEHALAKEFNQFLDKTRPRQLTLTVPESAKEPVKVDIRLANTFSVAPGKTFELVLDAPYKKGKILGDQGVDERTIQVPNPHNTPLILDCLITTTQELPMGEQALQFPPRNLSLSKEEQARQARLAYRMISITPSSGCFNLQSVKAADGRNEAVLEVVWSTSQQAILPKLLQPFPIQLHTNGLAPTGYTEKFSSEVVPSFAGSTHKYFAHLQNMYDRFILHTLKQPLPNTLSIPLITHTIWFTNPTKPQQPSAEAMDCFVKNVGALNGWRHIVWMNQPNDCPQFEEYLSKNFSGKRVGIKYFSKETPGWPTEKRQIFDGPVKQAVARGEWGKASDISRLLVLSQCGGLYLDTDMLLLMNLEELHRRCTFYAGLEHRNSGYLGNAIIGSSPNNPILDKTLLTITQRFAPQAEGKTALAEYINTTLHQTGPFAFTQGVWEATLNNTNEGAVAAGEAVIFPLHVFYHFPFIEGKKDERKQRKVWHISTLAAHLEQRSWIPPDLLTPS